MKLFLAFVVLSLLSLLLQAEPTNKTDKQLLGGNEEDRQAVLGALETGGKIVGSVLNYFDNKAKEHQKYLKEHPEGVDLGNDKLEIKMKSNPGYIDPEGAFDSGGFDMVIDKKNDGGGSKESGGAANIFPAGIGPMLMNGCFGSNYKEGDPCYNNAWMTSQCLNMIEAANYVGVGFDGTGDYSHSSRKKSLVQRMCTARSTYQGEDVPDIMNIFGIYDTGCTGKSYDSLDARSEVQREESDMGSNEDLLRYKGGSKTKMSGSVGWSGVSAEGSHSSSGRKTTKTENRRSSKGSAESKDEATKTRIFEFMCKIRRYNIFLDEVTPSQLSSAFLEDYMSLPIRYYDFSQQAPLRFSRFLQRWGTHYIKSASFGGKFTLLRESRMRAKETKTEWAERVQEDTSQMFESKELAVSGKAKVNMWTASAAANIDTKSEQNADTSAKSSEQKGETNAKNKQASSFSMDDILVEGGDQKVASILSDKDRSGFKAEFTDWLESIPTYPKGYDFKFGELPELLNMNYRSLLNDKFKPCWTFKNRYNLTDHRGQLVCQNCLYDVTVKNKDDKEEIEVRKCQFQDIDDFQDKMERKRLSLKRAIDIFVKNGGRSTYEITLPGGVSRCESFNKAYNEISYKDLLSGETYQVDFDLREDMGEEIQKTETLFISFKQSDDRWGRWAIDDSASIKFAGQYSKRIEVDEESMEVLINGVYFTYESDKSGNYLKMTEHDCQKNKERITSMEHQSCDERKDLYWINIPLASVRPIRPAKTFHPCNLEWTNANMLMSDKSCVRFSATSMGPIYFALSAIPDRPDAMYYVRISPNDVTIYKNSILMDSKTAELDAVGLGHKDIIQSYIICSEYEKEGNQGFTRITYGKLDADETMNKDASLNAYLIMKDDESPISSKFFAFGNGEDKVHITDLELLELPQINCLGDTIKVNGHCVQACRKSNIFKMGKQTVPIKCYKEGSEKAIANSDSHVGEDSHCVAMCPDGEVAYPTRTVCKGDSTWTNELRCYKECDKKDPSIINGLLVKNGNKETKTLKGLTIECPNENDFGDLTIKGVRCNVVCGTDDSGFEYNPIGQVECSDDSKWIVNSKKDQNVCKSMPCSPIKEVSNGILQCKKTETEIKAGSGHVSEGTECSIKTCNAKHMKEEPSTVTCSDGEWKHGENVATLHCLPTDKTCPAKIPSIEHGTVSCNDKDNSDDGTFLGATICTIECDAVAGYNAEDESNSMIQCVNGVWKAKTTCVDKSCPADLAKVGHGTVACDPKDKVASHLNYKTGSKCSVSCDSSHALQDANSSTIQCNGGVWESKAVCIDTYVLWLGPKMTLNIPDLSSVASNCQITNPGVSPEFSEIQMINGHLYACDGEHCKTYKDEGKTWTVLDGVKLKSTGSFKTGIVMNDEWIIQGPDDSLKGKLTTEVWNPDRGSWEQSDIYKSPFPVSQHCLVAYKGQLMQIGGEDLGQEDLPCSENSCSGQTNSGGRGGACTSEYIGKLYCYVKEGSCGDEKKSSNGMFWSYEACSTELTNKCFLGKREVASMKAARMAHGCSLFQGKIWVAGGSVSGGNSAAVEVYNPETDKWSDGPPLPITEDDKHPQLVDIGNSLYYLGGDFIGKIYRLENNKWVKVQDIEKGNKLTAVVMKKSCLEKAVDGQWDTWGSCSKTCGGGKKTRECINPKPMNGGSACVGEKEIDCNMQPCPIHGEWGSWGSCSETCGDGIKRRECNNPKPEHGGKRCVGRTETHCKTKDCPINGQWGSWGSCSKTCGDGIKKRECNNPKPEHGGQKCLGDEDTNCNLARCGYEKTTSYTYRGVECKGTCWIVHDGIRKAYNWCYKKSGGSDYCSYSPFLTTYNKECEQECSKTQSSKSGGTSTQNYFWCWKKNGTGWGYCSPPATKTWIDT